jgi:hypothetical protein
VNLTELHENPSSVILAVRGGYDNTVVVTICGKRLHAVLDTGAHICLLSESLASGLELKPCRFEILDANSNKIVAAGQAEIDVRIGNRVFRHTFVIASISTPVLIGADFCKRYKCKIDFDAMSLRVNDTCVPIIEAKSCAQSCCSVARLASCGDSHEAMQCAVGGSGVINGSSRGGAKSVSGRVIVNEAAVCESPAITIDVNGYTSRDRPRDLSSSVKRSANSPCSDVCMQLSVNETLSIGNESVPGMIECENECQQEGRLLCEASEQGVEYAPDFENLFDDCEARVSEGVGLDPPTCAECISSPAARNPSAVFVVEKKSLVTQCHADLTKPSECGETNTDCSSRDSASRNGSRSEISADIPPERLAAITELYERSIEHLNAEQRTEVWALLLEFHDVFSIDDSDLGKTDLVTHRIELTDNIPVKIPPRRLPIAKRAVVQKEVERLKKLGIVKPSRSAYSAPVVLVERGAKARLCYDYRKLNDKTKKDAVPSPNVDAIFDSLSGSSWFSALDLRSGFLQVKMHEDHAHLTAFCTETELLEFNYMPFGLTNSPATCVRLIEQVFNGMSPKALLAFVDDIMVHASTFKQECANLREALTRLRAAGLKLNLQKARLFQRETKFLGFIVSGDGRRPDESKVEAVASWPRPKNVAQLRSLLGLAAYNRRFVPQFSHLAKPLYDLTRAGVRFVWTDAQEQAFLEIKQRLSTTPLLCHYDRDAELVLDTDCSDHGLGACLSMIVDGKERVVAYYSKLLSKTERRYCVTRKELLAVVKALSHFHVYLYGHKRFTIRTDHSSLRWLMNFKDLEGQMARWLERMQLYDYVLVHRAGKDHGNADGLSRRPCIEEDCRYCQRVEANCSVIESAEVTDEVTAGDVELVSYGTVQSTGIEVVADTVGEVASELDVTAPLDQSMEVNRVNMSCDVDCQLHDVNIVDVSSEADCQVQVVRLVGVDLAKAQAEDEVLGSILQAKLAGASRPRWEEISIRNAVYKAWWSDWEALEVKDGLLCRRWVKDTDNRVLWLPAVPASLQAEVMKHVHDGVGAGHFGRRRTLLRLKDLYYWPQRRKTVVDWCTNCGVCACRKGPARRLHGPLQRYHSGAPMERVAIDILGALPVTERGNRYLLVAMDYFTKWPEAIPIPNQEAATVAEALVSNFFCRFGSCLELHSDQGRTFESAVMAEVCKLFGVHKTRTTALYPQGDGMVERMNRTLLNSLSAFVSEHQTDWDLYTPLVLLAYRTAVHEATGVAPCEAMLGRSLRGPVELAIPRPVAERVVPGSRYVQGLTACLESVQDYARAHLDLAGLDLKRRYDRNADKTGFAPGDAVWLYNPRVRKGWTTKLGAMWCGPYRVMDKLTDVVYRIQASPRSKPYTVNHYRLWRVSGSLPDNWWATGSRGPGTEDDSGEQPPPDVEHDPEREVADVDPSIGPPDAGTDGRAAAPDALAADANAVRTSRSGRPLHRPRRYREEDSPVSRGRTLRRGGVVLRPRALNVVDTRSERGRKHWQGSYTAGGSGAVVQSTCVN